MLIVYSPKEKVILDAVNRGIPVKCFATAELASLLLSAQSKKMLADECRRKGLVVNEMCGNPKNYQGEQVPLIPLK